ncbi:hypothetical protein MTHERMOG20_21420 [Moorella thermoacetica]|nr:hypothetical protein MTHERMOG20_21420 [Moorella thermoacetica]
MTGQNNHAPRQVYYFHWLAHIQDKDLPAPDQGAGLDNQLPRLGWVTVTGPPASTLENIPAACGSATARP